MPPLQQLSSSALPRSGVLTFGLPGPTEGGERVESWFGREGGGLVGVVLVFFLAFGFSEIIRGFLAVWNFTGLGFWV